MIQMQPQHPRTRRAASHSVLHPAEPDGPALESALPGGDG